MLWDVPWSGGSCSYDKGYHQLQKMTNLITLAILEEEYKL
jgi:hypothetical protein